MRAGTALVLAFTAVAGTASAADDLATKRSQHSFAETLSRLEKAAKEKGLVVFGRLDHAAAAAAQGLKMPASTVLVVGNPKVGTERFIKFPTYAIDLPLKVLVWEDQKGGVSVSYNTAPYMVMISKRHGLAVDEAMQAQGKRTEQVLSELADVATR